MKKILLLSAIAFAFCTAFTSISDLSKDIIGIWKIDESSIDGTTAAIIKFTGKTNPAMAQQMEEQLDGMKEMVRQLTVEYKQDNTYSIQTPQGPQSGKWKLSPDNKYLIISRPGKPDRQDEVLEITAARLLIHNKERGDTTLYVHP